MQKLEKLKTTIDNLFTLNKYNILNTNSVMLYLFYFSKIGKPCSLNEIRKHLRVSYLAIVSCNSVLQYLNLVTLKKQKGKTSIVESVRPLLNDRLQQIIKTKSVVDHVIQLRNQTFNKYYSKQLISTADRTQSKELNLLLSMLPNYCRAFKVTSKFLQDLKKLAKRVDLKHYIQWFIDKKIKTEIISGFSLSIFMYPTMITEYEALKGNYDMEQKRKRTTSYVRSRDTDKWNRDYARLKRKKEEDKRNGK